MKQYIKWIAKGLLLIIILAIIDKGIGKVGLFVKAIDSKSIPDYVTRVSSCDDDILIIGSSTANHHYISCQIQDSLGMSVSNFGLDGAFFIFQNCVINYLLDSIAPKYILWEIGEDCLSDNTPRFREYQMMYKLYPYYSSSKYIRKAIDDYDTWQRLRMMSDMYCDNSNMIHDMLVLSNVIRHGVPKTKKVEDPERGYKPLPNMGYVYPEIISDSTMEYTNPRKCEMLVHTIQKCKQRGVQIIFTSSPRHYDADLLSLQQAKELRRIAKEEGIPYLDFYHYEEISTDSTFFKDCDHLNANGAEAYMDVFIPSLKQVLMDL